MACVLLLRYCAADCSETGGAWRASVRRQQSSGGLADTERSPRAGSQGTHTVTDPLQSIPLCMLYAVVREHQPYAKDAAGSSQSWDPLPYNTATLCLPFTGDLDVQHAGDCVACLAHVLVYVLVYHGYVSQRVDACPAGYQR